MLEFIKEYDELIYDNFVSLTNNIKNKDKNINSQFRITAESILYHINKGEIFKKNKCNINGPSLKTYGSYIEDIYFMNGLIAHYKFSQKINKILKNIKDAGNDTIHNRCKIFDYADAKEKFRYLFFAAIRIYETENNRTIGQTQKNIDAFFDELFNSDITKSISENNSEILEKEELLNLNKNISEKYIENSDKEKFYSIDNITSIYELACKFIEYLRINRHIHDTDKLIENGYKKVYDFQKKLGDILLAKDVNNKSDLIYWIEDNLFDVKHLIEAKENIVIFDWYKFDAKKNNDIEEYNELNNYELIANEIEAVPLIHDRNFAEGRFYVTKKKHFIINDKKYYEIEIQKAVDNESKFDRKTIYTKLDIDTTYSIKISYKKSKYEFLKEKTEIFIVDNWEVSIRPCELYNLIYIFTGQKYEITKNEPYYIKLNEYLTANKTNLLEIILLKEKEYQKLIDMIDDGRKATALFIESLNKARDVIIEETNGCNVLRYLLYTLRNRVIKKQCSDQKYTYNGKKNSFMSDLVLDIGCMQFDKSPLSANLKNHINNYKDVLNSIPCKYRECEALAHAVDAKSIENQKLYIPIEELPNFNNIPELIKEYEMILSDNPHSKKRRICLVDNYLYKNDYVECAKKIIEFLKKYSDNMNTYTYKELLNTSGILNEIDNEEKKNLLLNMFSDSKISLIYGEAGSGKTEVLANYLLKIFKEYNIVYIANTHNAKENLKRRVLKFCENIPPNIKFYTVKQFNKLKYYINDNNPTVIFVDEAKVISNEDIYQLLKKVDLSGFDFMVFAGDVSQLESIKLGNWFDLAKKMLKKEVTYELNTVFRSHDENLKKLWTKVRNYDEDAIDYLIKNNYCSMINEEVFVPQDESEIILCLNYSGMYGINKINSYFQERNKDSNEYVWGMDKYKVGDKILFNDYATEKYDGVLYNNLKGIIKNIEYMNTKQEEIIAFTIKVEEAISEEDIRNTRGIIRLNGSSSSTLIQISAKKHIDKDTDEDNDDAVVPFDIAYALSIHKAQGLQYKSVKIIITPESDEIINNAIFYTAITRAEEKLKIYWTTTQQEKMLNLLTKKDINVDVEYLYK